MYDGPSAVLRLSSNSAIVTIVTWYNNLIFNHKSSVSGY